MTEFAAEAAPGRDSGVLRAARSDALGRTAVLLTAFAAAAWTALVGALAAWRHTEFLSHRADLGNMVQAIWSTSRGRPLEVTDGSTGEQVVRLAGHVDPILVLYVPFWWLHSSPETLVVAQAGALAAGLYPVVRLGLKYAESRLVAGLLGAWYLAIPWVVWLAFNELNPVTLALPALLYAIWFLDEGRMALFWVFAVLAMLTGELVGVTVAALGIWCALGRGRVRTGVVIAAVGAAWTTACLTLVIPAFNRGGESRFYEHFEGVGGSPTGLLRTLFTDPAAVATQMSSSGDFQYLAWIMLPTALLFLGAPLLLLVAAPQLVVNLLSEFGATVSPLYHYSAPVLAALIAASIMGLQRLPARGRAAAAGVALLLAVVLLGSIRPVPGQEAYLFPELESQARRGAMAEAVALVPPDAPITTTGHLGAHLSERRVVLAFPQQRGAEWAVLDTRDPPSRYAGPIGVRYFQRRLEELDRDLAWERVFEREGIRVYRREA